NAGTIEVSEETRREIARITATTFKRWSRKFKADKLLGLQPPAGNRAGSGLLDTNEGELTDFVVAMLAANHLLSAKLIWLAMGKHFAETGNRLPSCGAFRRWLRRWKLTHREHFARISNPDSHKGRFRFSLGCKA